MLGINARDIEQLLKDAYSENYVYLIKAQTQQYQVIVVADGKYRANPDNLNLLYLKSPSGQMVPLREVANWEIVPGPQSVNHINNFPSVTVFFDLKPGFAISNAMAAINTIADRIIPASVVKKFEGEAEAFSETISSLTALLFAAVFVMYIILGILYESYVHPLTVLSSLPVATVGGLATLYLLRPELSLYAYIGLFMLMGIVKKNGIMMIDFAIELQNQGASPYDAAHKACLVRFRPILMTSLAAFMGALPIALGWGAEGSTRIPLGLVIVGGMVVSQLVTLYITPVIYLYFDQVQDRLDRTAFFARKA